MKGAGSRKLSVSNKGKDHLSRVGSICIVSSCGGHLTEVLSLKSVYGLYDHSYVLNERIQLPEDMRGKTHFIVHAERDWRVLINLWEAWRILRRERPALILSTGAGPIVPFAIVGLALGIPTVYVESASRTAPSLTGRIMYRIADRFFCQWKEHSRRFPRGTYGGLLP